MREILFRGKQTASGEWSYGYIYSDGKKTYIAYEGEKDCIIHKIIPSTVGQYTGLTDKNGTRIFEGDIVSVNRPRNGTHEVIWDVYGWNLKNFYACCYDYPGEAFSEGTKYMSVVGNIHDNPELLEEVAQNGG